ncbi:MAG: hypothetical protein KDK39_07180 [Leptospiraceae bacterium]|nr:hypothetical protein [Leptospiraceae bacterium]
MILTALKPKSAVLIQARSNSSRLRGKIYAGLPQADDSAQLLHIYRRMEKVGADVVSVVVPENDVLLIDWCHQHELEFFLGSELDVRDRYRQAAAYYKADWIVRATGDNPCVDAAIARESLELIQKENLALFAYSNLPLGMAVEVISCQALVATAPAEDLGCLEHVSLHIKRNPDLFHYVHRSHPLLYAYTDLVAPRMTVDTAEDLHVVRQVFQRLGPDFGVGEVMDLARREPEIFHFNQHIVQRSTQDRRIQDTR